MEVDRPAPKENEVLIEVLYCGVCHSDIHQMNNDWKNTVYPCVPGHEIIGKVVSTGSGSGKFRAGEIVGVGCMIDSCQHCKSCIDDSDMYFLNKYELQLKNGPQGEAVKQTFYLSNKEDNITLKEAYNLLSGRSVHKELATKEGEKYNAWLQLDFKTIDKNGQYDIKKYHQNYGFDLEKTLAKQPIKELLNEGDKSKLIDSLQRGNRQSVTVQHEGKEQKVFIEASPQFKSLNIYDSSMKRMNAPALYEKKGEGETTKVAIKKEAAKTKAGDDDEEGPKQTQKKGRKKGMSVS